MRIFGSTLRAVVALVLVGVLAGPAVAQQATSEAASMFRGGPQGTGVYSGPAPAALEGVRFTFSTGGPIRGTPALRDGVLYFGSADRNFYALDADSGREIWRVASSGPINSSPAVDARMAYFTTRDNFLYAVSTEDGRVRWRVPLGRDLGDQNYWEFYTSSPVLYGANLYVGSGDGRVYAVNPRNGRVIWSTDVGSRVRSTPAVTEDAVVFGTMSGHVIALDRRTGAVRWRFATQGVSNTFATNNNDSTSVYASPTIADGLVVIGGRDAFTYGLDLATGEQRWRTTIDGGAWILGLGAHEGQVYIASGSAFVVEAAELATGAERWRFSTGSGVFASPTIVGDVLLTNDLSGTLYAVNRRDGAELWRFSLGDRAFSTPIARDGVVYASSDAGVLYALNTSPTPRAVQPVRRLVYAEGRRSPDAFSWFQNDIGVANLNYFRGAGYEQVSADQLRQAMNEQIASGARSVVVFADNHVPTSVADTETDQALIRRYLDAGGMVVFLGRNPLVFRFTPETGALASTDTAIPERILGIRFAAYNQDTGHHISEVSEAGRRWGLRGMFVGGVAMPADQFETVLAMNEFGMATAWAKTYNRGGLLLQLAAPNNKPVDLAPFRLAIEHGVARPGGQ